MITGDDSPKVNLMDEQNSLYIAQQLLFQNDGNLTGAISLQYSL
jgi:hypothetical protein